MMADEEDVINNNEEGQVDGLKEEASEAGSNERVPGDETTNNNDDKAKVSSSVTETSELDGDEFGDDDDDGSEMPLLKYSRIEGSLPRTASSDLTQESQVDALRAKCVCSTMGRVTISPFDQTESSLVTAGLGLSSSTHGTSAAANESKLMQDDPYFSTRIQTFYILALAMEDGTIHLIDHRTGWHICQPKQMKVHSGTNQQDNIVALSFDASGTYLAAVTAEGDVAIFGFKFGITIGSGEGSVTGEKATSTSGGEERAGLKVFDSFLSSIAGDDWSTSESGKKEKESLNKSKHKEDAATESSAKNTSRKNTVLPSLPMLQVTHPVSTARFSHKLSNSNSTKATCISLDPSYKRKRDKCVIVGFSNGRLIYTKRNGHRGSVADSGGFGGVMGNLLQPSRHDVDLFQSVAPAGLKSEYHGIEYITWRGTLVSWADASGIKLFEIEKMARIAHIDRPTGARSSLYPGISSLRPTMVFESSDSLLIAWGDCLMNMKISNSTGNDLIQSSKNIKRSVKCVMAWQLDCVACGVVPLDSEHVVVLGLVPCHENDEAHNSKKLVELQVISRLNGTVVQSDILPLISSGEGSKMKNSTANYVLTSSFATPRMEDSNEVEQEDMVNEEAVDFDIQSMLNTEITPFRTSAKNFVNPHMQWDVATYKCIISCEDQQEEDLSSVESESDEHYSDNYSFLFQDVKADPTTRDMLWKCPVMAISSLEDAVLVQARDVDDSIAHARSFGNHAVALKRGLGHRQIIRRHDLNNLIDEFLKALLFNFYEDESKLSNLHRLKIATRATSTLFGGNVQMWEKWIEEFAKVPGALFLLQPHIPIRDPILPSRTYEFVILGMLDELGALNSSKETDKEANHYLLQYGFNVYLETVRAWGPISSLRDRLKLHRLTINDASDEDEAIEQIRLSNEAKKAFSSRMIQSAENYLKFNFKSQQQHEEEDLINSTNLPAGITFDSLFELDSMLAKFEEKLNQNPKPNISSTIYEAIAEIYFMKGMYKDSLYNYLSLANHFENPISSVEEEAMKLLANPSNDFEPNLSNERFLHVLTMIEAHDLHRTLLKKRSSGRNEGSKSLPPLVALISLVGLEAGTNFIIYHCTLPRSTKPSTPNVINENRSDLPINQIAAQLNSYPKILFWFLQRIFAEKPEVYVQFPNTAVPPSAVTDLHRTHFYLHVDFADRSFDDSKKLTRIPTFDELNQESPMMKFLKAALPHGGIRSDDVRSALEKCRSDSDRSDGKIKFPHLFAHELAYVIERSGAASEDDAREVLTLYLEGVVSLPLAVEYVQRHTSFSSVLWEALVAYCLNAKIDVPIEGSENNNYNEGQLFGSLLEVAARSGADLAHLVSKIPAGMSIHGIRSKLVTAISDYRFKLKINEDAARILQNDKVSLLREQCHRSRRGLRIDLEKEIERKKTSLLL